MELTQVVNVLVDGFAHLGPLSYQTPSDLRPHPGDAVEVPFGKRIAHGVVLGPGDPAAATRAITKIFGPRVSDQDIDAAEYVAKGQLTPLQLVGQRFAPRRGKSATAIEPGPLRLNREYDFRYDSQPERKLLINPPLVKSAELAAHEAHMLAANGQVLILCPTTNLVEQVLNQYASGVVRLDAKAPAGSWQAFRDGSAHIAVGTRVAAWYSAARLAAIIVVDEHNEGHREQSTPRHHSRDVAAARAKAHGARLTLISPTPTPAGIGLVAVVERVWSTTMWPRMTLHDSTNDYARSPHIPYPVIARIRAAESTPLVVITGHCTRRCTSCFEERDWEKVPTRCPVCGTTTTRLFGYDRERVYDILGQAARPVDYQELETCSNAGLVVIPDLMDSLRRPSLIPYSHADQLIVAAAQAAGPRGEVVGVTRGEAHPAASLLFRRKDQLSFARSSYQAARRLNLPPFGRLVNVQITRKTPPDLTGWPGHVHGPLRTGNAWEVLVRCTDDELPGLRRQLERLKKAKVKLRYHVD